MASDDSRLTEDAKAEIRKYIVRVVAPFGALLSVLVFFIGFFTKDVAERVAEAGFIEKQYEKTMSTVMSAERALSSARDISARIKSQSQEISTILDKSNKTLVDAKDVKKTIDTAKLLAETDNVLRQLKKPRLIIEMSLRSLVDWPEDLRMILEDCVKRRSASANWSWNPFTQLTLTNLAASRNFLGRRPLFSQCLL